MTFPASIASGSHATDSEITDMQAAVTALLSRSSGVVDVRTMGAAGDGSTDDTAAIQSAINACFNSASPAASNTRIANKTLYLPAGTYCISSPLRVWSVQSLTIRGDGNETILKVTAPISGAILDLNGVSRCTFADFQITGSTTNTFTHGIFLRWDSGTANRSTCFNIFSNVEVSGKFVNGFTAGDSGASGAQVSEDQFYSCRVIGQWTAGEATWWQNGILFGDDAYGNNLNHSCYGCEISNVRQGVFNDATNVAFYGGMIEACETDLYTNNAHGYFKADGFRSENSQRLLFVAFAQNPKNIEINNVQWNITSNVISTHKVVDFEGAGTLILRNVQFRTGSGGTGIQPICWINTAKKVNVILEGVHVGGTGSTLASFVQGSASVNVIVLGAIEEDDSGLATAQWGQVLFSDGIQFGQINAAAAATAPDVKLSRTSSGILSSSGGLASAGGISPGTDAGVAQSGRLFMGSGAPNNANGTNGDFYFRTGTPGTGTQMIYQRVAGAWTGIV